jgi:hypothetical protein
MEERRAETLMKSRPRSAFCPGRKETRRSIAFCVALRGTGRVKRWPTSLHALCEKRSDEAIHLKFELDCRSRQGSFAMTDRFPGVRAAFCWPAECRRGGTDDTEVVPPFSSAPTPIDRAEGRPPAFARAHQRGRPGRPPFASKRMPSLISIGRLEHDRVSLGFAVERRKRRL